MKKIICLVLVLVFALCLFVACDKTADNTEYYDKITKTLKLSKAYQGKSFLTDGIGEAQVSSLTDGDTTTFSIGGGNSVVIRYYGIDTPESTGNVEKWGKAASLFVKEKLSKATLIVLESTTGGVPEKESYGRTLGYVWYKGEGDSDLKLLNLEIVENGFSENGCINTSAYAYYKYFKEAEDFAKSIELRRFSKLDDPLYSTDPVTMTLKDFWKNTEAYYNQESEVGSRVVVVACLTELEISNSGTHTFKAVEYDPATGEMYTLNVYAGYASAPASTLTVGHLYRIVGTVGKHYDEFQLTGITWNAYYNDPSYTTVQQPNYYLTFSSSKVFKAQYLTTLYSDVTVVSSSVENGKLTIVGTANMRKKDSVDATAKTFTFTVPVADGYTNVFTAGTKFSVSGFQLVANSGNISIVNYSDITIIQ